MVPSLPALAADTVVAALLAGGSSRRMGSDKTTALLGGRLLAHWAAAALAATCRHRVQVGGEPLPGIPWKVLSDLRPGTGPAAAIETALSVFPGCAVVVCPVDCPFVAPSLLRDALGRLDENHLAAIPRFDGRWHPLVGAYSPAVLPALQAWLDSQRLELQAFLDRTPTASIEADELARHGDPEIVLLNVNTPDDLVRAAEWLAQTDHL